MPDSFFGWGGITVGIISTAIAIFFGITSRKHRKLLFSINPIRTKIVTSNQATALKVSYRDESLGNVDITAVQFAIWNAGNEPIKETHIRKPICITTMPKVRILEATLRTATPESKFTVSIPTNPKVKGNAMVKWETLERKEGASIQLLYLGTQDVVISLDGFIEGQGKPKEITTSPNFKSLQEHNKTKRNQFILLGVDCLVLIITTLLKYAMHIQSDYLDLFFMFSISLIIFMPLIIISTIRQQFPPFGF